MLSRSIETAATVVVVVVVVKANMNVIEFIVHFEHFERPCVCHMHVSNSICKQVLLVLSLKHTIQQPTKRK